MRSTLKLVSLAALTSATLALPAAAEYGDNAAKCKPAAAKCGVHKGMSKCHAKKCAPKCAAKCHANSNSKCNAKCGAKK